jgi:hypothetical protein
MPLALFSNEIPGFLLKQNYKKIKKMCIKGREEGVRSTV